jgi:hypothetical protein
MVVFNMQEWNKNRKEPLTRDDLDRISFRAEADDSADFVDVTARTASDLQFDAWAKFCAIIKGQSRPWSLEERVRFCNQLYQQDALELTNDRG